MSGFEQFGGQVQSTKGFRGKDLMSHWGTRKHCGRIVSGNTIVRAAVKGSAAGVVDNVPVAAVTSQRAHGLREVGAAQPRRPGASRWLIVGAAGIVSALALAAPAPAATVVSPADGETVSSRPEYVFDFVDGAAELEASRSPDVQTSGANAGEFVDADRTGDITLRPSDPLPGHYTANVFNSGIWYWHGKLRDDAAAEFGYGDWTPWSEVRTMRVPDEPAKLSGYTLSVRRAEPAPECAIVRLAGKVAWTDNDDKPEATFTLVVTGADGTDVAAPEITLDDDRYSFSVCTARTRLTVMPQLTDRVGQVTQGESRTVEVARPVMKRIPMLTTATAKRHLRQALAQRFSDAYRYGLDEQLSCSRRSRTRMRCHVTWVIGDASYSGKASIWLNRDKAGYIAWNYGWTIRRLDEYCAEVSHGKNCVKTYRVS
jgi:hypothetical protein